MSADPNDPSPKVDPPSKVDLERRRVPLERKISLKFKEFRGFITEYSQNLSMGGMFIRTTSPKPIGTIFDFELSLTDDFKLVQGIGEVLWVRETDDGPERPSGMGVRFLDLSSESRRLIQRIVEEQVAHGGTPFELEPPGFPPPPLRTTPPLQAPRANPQSTLFHPTAAPVAPAPPLPSRPAAAARAPEAVSAPAPVPAAPTPTPLQPSVPSAPKPSVVRQAEPLRSAPVPPPARVASPPLAAPTDFESFPDLGPPELPIPELFAVGGGGDVLPDLDSLEAETFEGLRLGDVEDEPASAATPSASALLPDLHEDPTLLSPRDRRPVTELPSVEQVIAQSAAAEPNAPRPWTTEPAPPHRPMGAPAAAKPGRIPSGFDEVARAFAETRAGEEPQGETRRIPTLEVPPDIVRPAPAAPPRPSPPKPEPLAVAAAPLAAPARRPPKRKRSWAAVAVAAALVLLLGGFAVLYLQFPELLPEWAGGVRPGDATATLPPLAPGGGPALRQQAPPPRAAADAAAAPPGAEPPNAAPSAAVTARVPNTAAAQPPSAAASPPADSEAAARAALGSDAPRARFTSIEEIWGQRSPLGTVVTIVTNGSVPADAFSHFRLEGPNPREVIRLRGVDDSYRRASVPVSTAEVKQVRLGYHARPDGNELHVVLDLASPRVKLLRSTPVDNRLELLLAAQ